MLSGPDWCSAYPTSKSTDDLVEPFRSKCKAFIDALQSAGATVTVADTYRPPARAWLLHWCCMIAYAKQDPATVPVAAIPATDFDIDIQWDHGNAPESIAAALAMAKGYGIVYPAALSSRHTQGLAIDMDITFDGRMGLNLPHYRIEGNNPSSLYAAGASYGVIKLLSDPPHWSSDGH